MRKKIISFLENDTVLCIGVSMYILLPFFSSVRYFFSTTNIQVLLLFKESILLLLNVIKYISYFLNVCVLSYLAIKTHTTNIPKKQAKILFILNILIICTMCFSFALIRFESSRYPNFLYSKIGISVQFLEDHVIGLVLLFFSVSYLLIEKKNKYFSAFSFTYLVETFQKKKNSIFLFLTFFSLSFFCYDSFKFIYHIPTQLRAENRTNKEKFGYEYSYIENILAATPEDSVIIHPRQSIIWPFIGNQPMIRYFLFPRTLVSAAILDENIVHTFTEVYVPYIDNGVTVWPVVDQKEKIVYFDGPHGIAYKDIEKIYNSSSVIILRIFF